MSTQYKIDYVCYAYDEQGRKLNKIDERTWKIKYCDTLKEAQEFCQNLLTGAPGFLYSPENLSHVAINKTTTELVSFYI